MDNQISVSKKVLEEYKTTINGRNIINRFWKSIYLSAPEILKKELDIKRTDLISVNLEDTLYKFYTYSGSSELNEYLSLYLIKIHSDSE